MGKKLVLIIAMLVILGGVLRVLVGPTTTTITVSAQLAQTEQDVTDRVRFLVGTVPGEPRSKPTLGNISLIEADPDKPNRYTVPPNTTVGAFALARGLEPERALVEVGEGEHASVTVPLRAGLVTLSTARLPDQDVSVVQHQSPSGTNLGQVRVADAVTLLLAEGDHRFATEAEERIVNVEAGAVQDVMLEDRQGLVEFRFTANVPWAENFPDVDYLRQDGSGQNGLLPYARRGGRFAFGEHSFVARLNHENSGRVTRDLVSDAQTVTVGAEPVTASFALDVQIIEPDLSSWDQTVLTATDVYLFSTSDPGKPFAMNRIAGGQAPLVFFKQDPSQTYALVVAKLKRVIAVQEIGAVDPDTPTKAAIVRGGSAAFCRDVAIGMNCESLTD